MATEKTYYLLHTSQKKKQKRTNVVVSTMHEHGIIDSESGDQNKTEVITYYNFKKGGADMIDELKGEYSVTSISCRKPLQYFLPL